MGTWTRIATARRPPLPGSLGFRAVRAATDLNTTLYRLTGGRVGGSFDGAPVLLLHHVGRKTGEERVTPLVYVDDGDDLVLVASMGGWPRNPAWLHNLRANPDTEVEVGRERRAVRARVATPEEKARLWPRAVEVYSGYATYQERTDRDIPLVVLERR